MKYNDPSQNDFFGTLDKGASGAPDSQPVRLGQRLKSPRKAPTKKACEGPPRESHSFAKPQPAPNAGAVAQRNRRDRKTAAGKRRVEAWVTSQIAERIRIGAGALKMDQQEFVAALITKQIGTI
jgi:hypothetical protein